MDVLYRRFDSSFERNVGSTSFSHATKGGNWQFPLYLKYSFGDGPIRPFITAGANASYTRTTNTVNCTGDSLLCGSGMPPGGVFKSSSAGGGLLCGGGLEFQAGVVKISPEFRYTVAYVRLLQIEGRNQAELLVGIRF